MSEERTFKFAMKQAVYGKGVGGRELSGAVVEQRAFVDGTSMYAVMTNDGDVYNCHEADLAAAQ